MEKSHKRAGAHFNLHQHQVTIKCQTDRQVWRNNCPGEGESVSHHRRLVRLALLQ